MWGAVGLSSFSPFDFVLFRANLDLVEFWLKSESGLRIISKVQMLLQQTFVLKKKYSKCQSRKFWTESRLAQEKTQNPTQLRSSHSLLFIGGGLSHKKAFYLSCLKAWLKHEFVCHPTNGFTLVFKTSSYFLEDACVKRKKWRFFIFDLRAPSGRLSHRLSNAFMIWCHEQNVWLIILWADS